MLQSQVYPFSVFYSLYIKTQPFHFSDNQKQLKASKPYKGSAK